MFAVTFYSFKGGVGRTSLATNVGALLAEAGQRVLLVDFDLEAPGLSYFPELRPADDAITSRPRGVSGFLADSWQANQMQDIRRYLYPVADVPDLTVLPAGDVVGGAYADDYRIVRQEELFTFTASETRAERLLGLFRGLREQWTTDFDYVLIDSRTGITDIGGICTRVLPDMVVAVLSLGQQARAGTREVLRQVRSQPLFGTEVHTLVVASMVPTDLGETRNAVEDLARDLDIPIDKLGLIPHRLFLVLKERPLYVREGRRAIASDELRLAYESVTQQIRMQNQWDLEFRLSEVTRFLTTDRDQSQQRARALVRDLLRERWPVPGQRVVRALIEATTILLLATPLRLPPGVTQDVADAVERVLQVAKTYPDETNTDSVILLARAMAAGPGNERSRATNMNAAQEFLRRALGIWDPDRYPNQAATILAERADILSGMDRHSEALADLDRALALEPTNAGFYADRGETYRLTKQYGQALADLDRALDLDSQNAWALGSRGQVHRALGHNTEALNDLDRALAIDSELTWILGERAAINRELRRYDQALADLDQVITLDPNNALALTLRAATYRALQQYDQALADLNRALTLDPNDSFALVEQRATYRALGQ